MAIEGDTGLAILGAAIGSKDIVNKVLGPTAQYLGNGIKHWTERRVNNVARIFEHAHRRLGEQENVEGSVHPKVLKDILDDGSFCEDELTAEYFGGVLASSRTGVSRDDRGATFTQLIARLSTYQIRLHFYFYRIFKELFDGLDFSVSISHDIWKMEVFVPFRCYHAALELADDEDINLIINHVVYGLSRENLIIDQFSFGDTDHMKKQFTQATEGGLTVSPSALGVELFHWAHGKGERPIQHFLRPEVRFESHEVVSMISGYTAVVPPTDTEQH